MYQMLVWSITLPRGWGGGGGGKVWRARCKGNPPHEVTTDTFTLSGSPVYTRERLLIRGIWALLWAWNPLHSVAKGYADQKDCWYVAFVPR